MEPVLSRRGPGRRPPGSWRPSLASPEGSRLCWGHCAAVLPHNPNAKRPQGAPHRRPALLKLLFERDVSRCWRCFGLGGFLDVRPGGSFARADPGKRLVALSGMLGKLSSQRTESRRCIVPKAPLAVAVHGPLLSRPCLWVAATSHEAAEAPAETQASGVVTGKACKSAVARRPTLSDSCTSARTHSTSPAVPRRGSATQPDGLPQTSRH